jgi:hypothetical protein
MPTYPNAEDVAKWLAQWGHLAHLIPHKRMARRYTIRRFDRNLD